MSIRFLHAADLHMDSPFEGVGNEKAALRRAEQRELPERIVDLAVESGAQLLLLAGDLLDSTSFYTQTGEALFGALSRLSIPVVISPGNHDFVTRRSIYLREDWPDNVHIFSTPELQCLVLPELNINVWGAGYTSRSCPPLLKSFSVPPEERDKLNILLLHAEIASESSAYAPLSEQELAQSGLNYAALGHVHTPSGLKQAGSCFYAWPGCPEGRGFDECGEKGVYLGSLEKGICRLQFVPTGKRQHRILSVPAGENALSAVKDVLTVDCENDIIRVLLTGECKTPPDIAFLQSALESRCFSLSILDATEPPCDIWNQIEENTLTGRFLHRMRRLLDIETDEDRRTLLLQATKDGLAVLEGREVRL